MELTLSQSGALFLAHRRDRERRTALFARFAAAARVQATKPEPRISIEPRIAPRLHPDNGR